ncbi:hypothetical protein ESZ50_05655 [Weissella muntiaci]|uniref:Uncharacterized protein n=1 Tax=Weissella muntiaci TaxID=2508881 RepID=A0A6C2C7R7_9LACO|nr:hypothetical protein [Weissella muntiaci]TYC49629.1 hypothetical protein ESZ50_05655 [Weissella muntiaci]
MAKMWAVKDLSTGLYISEVNLDGGTFELHKDLAKHFSMTEARLIIDWLYNHLKIEDDEGEFAVVELTEKVVEDD